MMNLDLMTKHSLLRIRHGVYVTNLDDKNSKGSHWVLLFIGKNLGVYFDSFGIECNPQKVLNKIKDKSITHDIFRTQDNESVMCGFYCIACRINACRKNFVRSY